MKLIFQAWFSLILAAIGGLSSASKVEVTVDDNAYTVFDAIDAKDLENVSSWYSWDSPQHTSANTPKDANGYGLEFYNTDWTGIAAVETKDGVSVALIFDSYDSQVDGDCIPPKEPFPEGGLMTSKVTCTGECSSYPDPKFMDVLDDSTEIFHVGKVLYRNHSWFSCRTDGYATDTLVQGDEMCLEFPNEIGSFGVEKGIRFYEMVNGLYTPTKLTTGTVGHKICVTIGCTRKKLLTPCEKDDECCSGMCTGRKPDKKKCRYCARKKEMCDTTADCCQSDFGRVCHPLKKKCVRK